MAASILTVDDSASMRQMLGFILRSAGYDVVQAANSEEALNYAGERRFDMILTDQNMPGSDGISLVQALRALPAYSRTPIVLLTTESSDEMKAMGRAAGATGWMVKPFDPNRLLEVVRKFVS
ncbi:Chemotaxis regulator - transmits chemoreceptor signals to flagelllar motor components CheY [Georgfuchsia toluolica]|uniref:Chemotaxis regulator - transmits chemoreceptor signals to flagelllar motor components CheY n=1 Tax=Georgfuchsia toluolica TaxID=424218 RepID=A0A916J1W7_9PROT|nr:response regulator [Georgfuchsia toluolica]CAG4882625.1 Chemotaxis regulator - transmits chemoreceptor signals to flagelllar motor components CheY [Georgfuchsia toluolica]